MNPPTYFDAADIPAIRRDYPLGDAFLDRFVGMSSGELWRLQNERFRQLMAFAWRVPFYRRLWGAAGIEPGDICGVEDLPSLPIYSKADLMDAVERFPPIGDFHGLDCYPPESRPPLIFQTTSGTTGRPQPLLYGPKSRETQNALLARVYLLQGMRRDDVAHSVYGFGMVNGGHYVRETVLHWLGVQMLSAGTGAETRSAQQVTLMRDFRATVLLGFGDFVRRLADIARENGIEPGRDIKLRMISGHLGPDGREPMSEAWGGCKVYDWYGVGDTGVIAGEAADQSGMYVMEDAHLLEILDPGTGVPVEPGTPGEMVCTCLFKDDLFPIIRFNTHDVTEEIVGEAPLGVPFRRILGFRGRSDNMVKLRGINVYPTAIGGLLANECAEFTGEYVCRVERVAGRDTMTVVVEVTVAPDEALAAAYCDLLRTRLGVEISVAFAAPGELASLTGIDTRQKPIRLIDERASGS